VKDSNHTSAPGKGNRPEPLDEHTIFEITKIRRLFQTTKSFLRKKKESRASILPLVPHVVTHGTGDSNPYLSVRLSNQTTITKIRRLFQTTKSFLFFVVRTGFEPVLCDAVGYLPSTTPSALKGLRLPIPPLDYKKELSYRMSIIHA
jgi:hypothetical protein